MISDLSIHCLDPNLSFRDFTWFADIRIDKDDINTHNNIILYIDIKCGSDENSTSVFTPDRRRLLISARDFFGYVLDEVPGVLWPIIIPISLVSYFYQKRTLDKFKKNNAEYFI